MTKLWTLLQIMTSVAGLYAEERLVIDRVDDGLATVESSKGMFDLDVDALSLPWKEGMVIRMRNDVADEQETLSKAASRIERLSQASQELAQKNQ